MNTVIKVTIAAAVAIAITLTGLPATAAAPASYTAPYDKNYNSTQGAYTDLEQAKKLLGIYKTAMLQSVAEYKKTNDTSMMPPVKESWNQAFTLTAKINGKRVTLNAKGVRGTWDVYENKYKFTLKTLSRKWIDTYKYRDCGLLGGTSCMMKTVKAHWEYSTTTWNITNGTGVQKG